MTTNELQQKHPEIFNEVFSLGRINGTTKECIRINSWLSLNEKVTKEIKNGIDSNEEVPEVMSFYAEIDKKLQTSKN